MKPNNLLNGKNPTIKSAIDKHKYFLEVLRERNPSALKELTFLERYTAENKKLLAIDKYGFVLATPSNLLSGRMPDITSAIDKDSYLIEKIKEIHGDKLDYSKVKYINARTKITLRCKIHNISFKKATGNVLTSKQGCPICGHRSEKTRGWRLSEWIKASKKSKNFDSYKLYILKCLSDREEFYKVGITYTTVENRYRGAKSFPYRWEIKKIISGSPKRIWELESALIKLIKKNDISYSPVLDFGGKTECFKDLEPIINYLNDEGVDENVF